MAITLSNYRRSTRLDRQLNTSPKVTDVLNICLIGVNEPQNKRFFVVETLRKLSFSWNVKLIHFLFYFTFPWRVVLMSWPGSFGGSRLQMGGRDRRMRWIHLRLSWPICFRVNSEIVNENIVHFF